MEFSGGSELCGTSGTAKKRRSSISRRPRPDLGTLLETYAFVPRSTQSAGTCSNEGNQRYRDSNVVSHDGLGSENKLKLKLKFGGVTRTLQTNSTVDCALASGASVNKSTRPYLAFQSQQKQDQVSNCSYTSQKWKPNYVRSKVNYFRVKTSEVSASVKETCQAVRKSKRVPKRRALDVGFDGDNDDHDDELRYLGRLNARVSACYEERIIEDKDYIEEEEELTSENETAFERKRLEKGHRDSFIEGINESSIPTTRNRAYKSAKYVLSQPGASLLEFPNGLPSAPSRKQKEKLSDMEQQLKKAEAAQRRRMQTEKAAREAEAEAIRKILGQDSARKKKDEKLKKQRDELAQGRSNILGSNTIRWVSGPTGTVVLFSEDVGLPNIFHAKPCSYPPPRDKCAGPNCTNSYKYRDSKSNLPLCSLKCYRAIHGKTHHLAVAY